MDDQCGYQISRDQFCVLSVGHGGDHRDSLQPARWRAVVEFRSRWVTADDVVAGLSAALMPSFFEVGVVSLDPVPDLCDARIVVNAFTHVCGRVLGHDGPHADAQNAISWELPSVERKRCSFTWCVSTDPVVVAQCTKFEGHPEAMHSCVAEWIE